MTKAIVSIFVVCEARLQRETSGAQMAVVVLLAERVLLVMDTHDYRVPQFE